MSWYEQRFTERPNAIHSKCVVCNRSMWMPPSKAPNYLTCGGECSAARYAATKTAQKRLVPKRAPRQWSCEHCHAAQSGGKAIDRFCGWTCLTAHRQAFTARLIAERTRACEHCQASFVVKKSQIDSGHGRYCSNRCAFYSGALAHLVSAENLQKSADGHRAAIASGARTYKSGPEHFSWKGGRDATTLRRRDKTREKTRQYRAKNPHKVREFRVNRRSMKLGRLPKGTVARIGDGQRWKCPICRVGIAKKYHVDHIVPLKRGGRHEPLNIQLLCPTCNVRKSAKDPVAYMQERGFLL